jgi:cytochrome P450
MSDSELTRTKYSKNEQVFVLPNLTTGPEVILPMSQMKWLLEQPDDVLNQNEVNSEFLHAERTMLHPHVIRDTVHGHIIKREMTKDLDSYADAVVDEIQHSLKLVWGSNDQDWKEVPLYDTMLNVVGRISNRVLVGLPLCRNEGYLRSTTTFARSVVITAGLINLLPSCLRPILGPLITAYDKTHYYKIAKHIFPIVRERMIDFKPGMDYRNPDYSKHNDYIQWALHDAYSHDDPAERTPEMITKRLTVLSFAAIQSSVITVTNALFDIASSSRCEHIQESLREEVVSVTSEKAGQEWKKASLSLMIRVDSALRESMRLWGFISRGVMKKVVTPTGIHLPSGEYLPFGSKVGVTSYGIHHDESAYPNALHYNPFRFSDATEECQKGEKSVAKPLNLITTSDNLMAFSHGRHAW